MAGKTKRPLPMFLDSKQLQDMTGYRRRASQVKWLVKYGYIFDIRRDGRPNVLIDQIKEILKAQIGIGRYFLKFGLLEQSIDRSIIVIYQVFPYSVCQDRIDDSPISQ